MEEEVAAGSAITSPDEEVVSARMLRLQQRRLQVARKWDMAVVSPMTSMDAAVAALRLELMKLLYRDDAIFKQLVALQRTVLHLKQLSLDDEAEDDDDQVAAGSRKASVDSGTMPSFELNSSCCTSPSVSPLPSSSSAHLPRKNVTFPLSRRWSRSATSSRLSKSFSGHVGATAEENAGGGSAPSSSLVRSTSITVLPRGVLVRRESSFDSGFDGGGPGEVFV